MKSKILTVLLGVFLASQINAQNKSDYLDMYLDVSEKKSAKFERKLFKTGEKSFKGEIFNFSGVLKASGEYMEVESDLIPHGDFTFYYPNGQIESQGRYVMGYKVETWRRFMVDGKEMSPKYYKSDLGNMIENIHSKQ